MGRPSSRTKRRARRSSVLLRWLALGVIVFVGFLYSHPLRSYLERRAALAERSAEVDRLRARHERLERRLRASESVEALAREARRLGLVRPGERLFIVKGIERWREGSGDGGDEER